MSEIFSFSTLKPSLSPLQSLSSPPSFTNLTFGIFHGAEKDLDASSHLLIKGKKQGQKETKELRE
jgi:hypothetical protein